MRPLCVDLFCGLGGWTEGFLAEGWDVIGFDIERHAYGEHRYPAQLVLQDVRTLTGRQFAAEIKRRPAFAFVASSPCQAYSYMAMPWTRAKRIAKGLLGEGDFPEGYVGYRTLAELNELFEQPERIRREAEAAAGRKIPLIQENVRGAQRWVGNAAWHYGSYYLWGDVPALMPFTTPHAKVGSVQDGNGKWVVGWNVQAVRNLKAEHQKNTGGSWFAIGSPGQKVTGQNPVEQYVQSIGVDAGAGTKGYAARLGESTISRRHGSKSRARKAASAAIAKIPFPLARHIAQVYRQGP